MQGTRFLEVCVIVGCNVYLSVINYLMINEGEDER